MSIGLIITIGLGVVIAIAAIVGLVVGFTRQFSKPLVGLFAIIGAIIVVTLVYPLIFNTGIFNGFIEKVTGWFSADFYTTPITSAESFQEAVSGNYLRILSGSAEKIFARMQTTLAGAEVLTIGSFFGTLLVNFLMKFVLWLVSYLIIKYFLFGIKYLLCKVTQVVVFKSIDKILGLIWSLLWTYVIVVGIILTVGELVIVQFVPSFESTFAQWITDSALLKAAHDSNIIGSFIANLLGMPLVTLI